MDIENIYEAGAVIHQGQMSIVREGRDLATGEAVILKSTPPANDPVAKNSLQREIEILKKINHQDIPRFYAAYGQGHQLVAVMERKEGKTLKELLAEGLHPDVRQVRKIGLALGEILLYLHSRENPIIHRDIKPENILCGERLSLIDFGAAREYDRNTGRDTICLGTVGFAAPEQFGGGQSDVRTDIYGFGMTLGKLAGQMSGTSRRLDKIVSRCTRKNPEDRYQDMEELMAALYGLQRRFFVPRKIVAVTVLHTDVRI